MSTHPGCNQFKHAPGCGHPGATGGPAEAAGIDLTALDATPDPILDVDRESEAFLAAMEAAEADCRVRDLEPGDWARQYGDDDWGIVKDVGLHTVETDTWSDEETDEGDHVVAVVRADKAADVIAGRWRHHPSVQALGDLTEDQERLLGVLLNPDNDEPGYFYESSSVEDTIEEWDNIGDYGSYDSYSDAQRVADMLRAHYYRERRAAGVTGAVGNFTFGFESNSDGEIGSYSVGVYLGHETGMYLTESHDTKYLSTDREATGLGAALGYAESIDGDYQRILSKARESGLLDQAAAQEARYQEYRDSGYRGPMADWLRERVTGQAADQSDPVARARRALASWDATPEGDDIDVDTMQEVRDTLAALLAEKGDQ